MSKRCKFTIYTILGIIALCIVAFLIKLLFFSGIFTPLLKVKGERSIEVEVNTAFRDPGVVASYRLGDFSDDIQVESTLNMKKLGTYTISYLSKKYDKEVIRTVKVVDKTAPELSLKGNQTIRVFENGTYIDSGAFAEDNCEGDISNKIRVNTHVNMKKQGKYTIQYVVRDASGNTSEIVRNVQVCPDPTKIKLYYNHDSYDNTPEEWWFRKSKDHQRTTGAKPEALLKKYDTFYQGPDEKVIYLTFDEGGNDVTYSKEIASVLNENDVKATFFFTRNYIKSNPEFMRDLVKHGHVIGNHTWHHYDMTTLANEQSVDSFVKEISETEKTYMEVCGEPMKKIFRFPKGGSSERAMQMVKDLGYRTYNWSHAYYDYASDVHGVEALKTMMDHYHNGAIYLLHPSNKGNYDAMDSFVKKMKEKGYIFDTVDSIK